MKDQIRLKEAALNLSWINLLVAGLAIIAGGLIYILCRPGNFSFFGWFHLIGLSDELTYLRAHALPTFNHLPSWFSYSLPDGLWAFAYTLIILTIWTSSKSITRYFWYASIPLFVLGSELLQLSGTVRGTFSLNDIVLISIGLLAGVLTGIITPKKLNYESKN
ncbi:MAG: hypothetical protein WC699_00660 [Bacteroidales bacterium]|jgi:hypothetical protein